MAHTGSARSGPREALGAPQASLPSSLSASSFLQVVPVASTSMMSSEALAAKQAAEAAEYKRLQAELQAWCQGTALAGLLAALVFYSKVRSWQPSTCKGKSLDVARCSVCSHHPNVGGIHCTVCMHIQIPVCGESRLRSHHVIACSAAAVVSCVQACWQELDVLLQVCSWLPSHLHGHALVELCQGHTCLALVIGRA